MKRIVMGILAHVDSGKTTLSEGILFKCGEIRKLGRVDHKNSFLDNDLIERERGITIFSKQAVFHYNNSEFTLLDTPGHIDFSAETERTLQVLDYAVLIASAPEGVQNHTETLWMLLKRYNVPVFIFVNKMDITNRSAYDIICELRGKLSDGCADFSQNINIGEYAEYIAMQDEALMEKFLEDKEFDENDIIRAVKHRKLFPCFFGSALKLEGIDMFLKCLEKYTSEKDYLKQFGARVFKIGNDERGQKLTFMKITGGKLSVRDTLSGNRDGKEWSEKVSQLRIYSGDKYKTVSEVFPGMVCAASGLTQAYPGEGLGTEKNSKLPLLEPVLSYAVVLKSDTDSASALKIMKRLEDEDPMLRVSWNNKTGQINILLMGEVQLEIVRRILYERFKLDVDFDRGSIAYKETIASAVEGVGHFEPLRHYAEVHLLIEPAARGSGIILKSDCSTDMLDTNIQRLVLTHLAEKSHVGVLCGFPLTDVKITLISGKAHIKHTEGGDFRQASYRAVRQGLMQAKNILLEPWYEFNLSLPQDAVGRALSDLDRMSAKFSAPIKKGEFSVITGRAPVSEMMNYHLSISGYTGGKGRLNTSLAGYDVCHNAEEVIDNIGYDSERDTDNPSDSIFCSHGAGFSVKWDEVSRYMHVQGSISENSEEKSRKEKLRRAEEYVGSIEQDKELLAIFERTYGPVKRRSASFLHTKKETESQKPYKAKPIPLGDEYLLVDGYNIIFAWEELHALSEKELELARESLINILCNYAGFKKCRVILVFDAYKVKHSKGEIEKVHNIDVVYTKEAETADMYIEKVTHVLTKNHKVRVATSDALEQLIILGGGAVRVSAHELHEEIKEAEKLIRQYLKDN